MHFLPSTYDLKLILREQALSRAIGELKAALETFHEEDDGLFNAIQGAIELLERNR